MLYDIRSTDPLWNLSSLALVAGSTASHLRKYLFEEASAPRWPESLVDSTRKVFLMDSMRISTFLWLFAGREMDPSVRLAAFTLQRAYLELYEMRADLRAVFRIDPCFVEEPLLLLAQFISDPNAPRAVIAERTDKFNAMEQKRKEARA